jgi:hypothetical protein
VAVRGRRGTCAVVDGEGLFDSLVDDLRREGGEKERG